MSHRQPAGAAHVTNKNRVVDYQDRVAPWASTRGVRRGSCTDANLLFFEERYEPPTARRNPTAGALRYEARWVFREPPLQMRDKRAILVNWVIASV